MKTWKLVFRKIDQNSFEDLQSGIKKIETRACSPRYQNIQEGDQLEFTCGDKTFTKIIVKRYHWGSIDEMLKEFSYTDIMPEINSEVELRQAYSSYPGYDEKIAKYGLLGFKLK